MLTITPADSAAAYLPGNLIVALKRQTCAGVQLEPGDPLPAGLTEIRVRQMIRTRMARPARSDEAPRPVEAAAGFTCNVCGRTAKTKLALGAHKRVHKD